MNRQIRGPPRWVLPPLPPLPPLVLQFDLSPLLPVFPPLQPLPAVPRPCLYFSLPPNPPPEVDPRHFSAGVAITLKYVKVEVDLQ
jgi:hypothetical protein